MAELLGLPPWVGSTWNLDPIFLSFFELAWQLWLGQLVNSVALVVSSIWMYLEVEFGMAIAMMMVEVAVELEFSNLSHLKT